jgi:hypothetical protein
MYSAAYVDRRMASAWLRQDPEDDEEEDDEDEKEDDQDDEEDEGEGYSE